MTLIQKMMSSENSRKKITARFLQEQLQSGPSHFPLWECQPNKEKKNIYINIVKTVIERKMEGQNIPH